MTLDEVLTMKPGRELDALVAEKVMNWKYFPVQVTDTFVRLDYFFDPVSGEARHLWNPSTDIAAAWEVVEKMMQEYDVSLWSDRNGKWACEIIQPTRRSAKPPFWR